MLALRKTGLNSTQLYTSDKGRKHSDSKSSVLGKKGVMCVVLSLLTVCVAGFHASVHTARQST